MSDHPSTVNDEPTRPVKPIPAPAAVEERTTEMPVGELPPPPPPKDRPGVDEHDEDGPDERQPWPITQLRTRLRSLTKVGRGRNAGFAAAEVESLFDDMLFTIADWMRRHQVEEEANRRLRAEHRKLHSDFLQLREQHRVSTGGHEQRTPVAAVTAIQSGHAQGEQIIADARRHAQRVIANAHEEANRIKALAQLDAAPADDRPAPTENLSDYLLAVARWLPRAIAAAETRVDALRAAVPAAEQLVEELHDERDGLANVLPIISAVLTGDVRDVAEVGAKKAPAEVGGR